MVKYRIKSEQITWPRKCAACGDTPTATMRARCSVVAKVGYYVVLMRLTHRVATIEYPVCARHFTLARYIGMFAERNLLNLLIAVMLLVFPLLAVVGLLYDLIVNSAPIGNFKYFLTNLTIVIGVMALMKFITRYNPVKMHSATDETITLSFTNDSYANDFESLNKPNIQAKLRWWQS